jgi:2-polyprenyl-3-methyl-5-hydroxy-6-metoxy-1,4-benzoquinol methylase
MPIPLLQEDRDEVCPLCGKVANSLIRGAKRNLRHCLECDLVFVPSAYHPTPEEELHRYRQHQNSSDNLGYVKMLSEVLKLIQRFGPEGGNILDFGCGPGPVFVDLCRQAGFNAYGYDPHFQQELPEKIRFDVISAIEVWEHFRSPATDISSLLSFLAPNGLLAVRTLLHKGEENMSSWWYTRDNTHLSFYSQQTFAWIAEKFRLNPIFTDGEKIILFKSRN